MDKFNRTYNLYVETINDTIQKITLPITIEFSIERRLYGGANTMDLSIYNLSPNLRDQIFQDLYNSNWRNVRLDAGYQGFDGNPALSTVFTGNMLTAYSERKGVNVITKINALDGGTDYSLSRIGLTLSAGSTYEQLVSYCVSQLKEITLGTFEKTDGVTNYPYTRAVTVKGNPLEIMTQWLPKNYELFVDNKKLHIIKEGSTITSISPLLTDETGLLETPQRRLTSLVVKCMFQPQLVAGQMVTIASKISPIFNGTYRVNGVKHTGVISGAISDKVITELDLQAPDLYKGKF